MNSYAKEAILFFTEKWKIYDKCFILTFSGPHVNAHKHNVNNELKMLERFGYVYLGRNIMTFSLIHVSLYKIAMWYRYISFHAGEGTSSSSMKGPLVVATVSA